MSHDLQYIYCWIFKLPSFFNLLPHNRPHFCVRWEIPVAFNPFLGLIFHQKLLLLNPEIHFRHTLTDYKTDSRGVPPQKELWEAGSLLFPTAPVVAEGDAQRHQRLQPCQPCGIQTQQPGSLEQLRPAPASCRTNLLLLPLGVGYESQMEST